jgi:hypothetical protein
VIATTKENLLEETVILTDDDLKQSGLYKQYDKSEALAEELPNL